MFPAVQVKDALFAVPQAMIMPASVPEPFVVENEGEVKLVPVLLVPITAASRVGVLVELK